MWAARQTQRCPRPGPRSLRLRRSRGARAFAPGIRCVKAPEGDLAGSSPSVARGPHRVLRCGQSRTGVRPGKEPCRAAGPRGHREETLASLRPERGAQGLGGQTRRRRRPHAALAVHAGSRGCGFLVSGSPGPGGPSPTAALPREPWAGGDCALTGAWHLAEPVAGVSRIAGEAGQPFGSLPGPGASSRETCLFRAAAHVLIRLYFVVELREFFCTFWI